MKSVTTITMKGIGNLQLQMKGVTITTSDVSNLQLQ